MVCIGVVISALFLWAGSSPAEEVEAENDKGGALIEELFLGESAFPQEKGEFQITFGVVHLDGDDEQITDLSLMAEYGLTDWLQVEVEVPYRFIEYVEEDEGDKDIGEVEYDGEGEEENDGDKGELLIDLVRSSAGGDEKGDEHDADGLGDVEVGLLACLIQKEALVLSLALEVGLPTGDEDEELGEGKVEWEPSLLLATNLRNAQLYFGVGGEFADEEGSIFTYTAAMAYPVKPCVGVLELDGSLDGEEGDTAYLTPGMVWHGAKDVEVSFGVPIGLTNDSADWGIVNLWTVEF